MLSWIGHLFRGITVTLNELIDELKRVAEHGGRDSPVRLVIRNLDDPNELFAEVLRISSGEQGDQYELIAHETYNPGTDDEIFLLFGGRKVAEMVWPGVF